MQKNIMVIGGSGFIGSYIARKLAESGRFVIIYDSVMPTEERKWLLKPFSDKLKFTYGDVNDLPTLLKTLKENEIDGIIHAAAMVDVLQSILQPKLTFQINTFGTLNVLEAARIENIARVVYISTIGLYAPKQYEPIDENHPVITSCDGPTTPYAVSKLAAEALGMNYWAYHKIDFISLRLSSVYGVGMRWPMYIKPIIENAVKGIPTKFPSGGDMKRDFTYVKDVANAALKALDVRTEHLKDRIFNIATGLEPITIHKVVEIVKKYIPEAEINIGQGLSNIEEDNIYRKIYEERSFKIRARLNIERARNQLHWFPEYRIEEGIKDYIEMYRKFIKEVDEAS
jgi:nucleoside-diphosphate-sugar epimerase